MDPSNFGNQTSNHLDQDAIYAAKIAHDEANVDLDCSSDQALAILLQRQYDADYNSQLDRKQARLNGLSKVGVSFDNFKMNLGITNINSGGLSESTLEDQSDHDVDDADSNMVWDAFEKDEMKKKSRIMGRSGFVVDRDGKMITKHDIPTSSRKNVCRLMESKSDIKTGDAGHSKDDFMLTNYVYNQLKVHSNRSSRKSVQRYSDKKEKDCNHMLDSTCKMSEATKTIMDGFLLTYKLEKVNGVVGHGKESTIIHATGRDHNDKPGQEVAIKVFESNMKVAFKTRDSYNKSKCPSYKFDRPKSKHDSLNKWAERGFKNLKLLRRADINCPDAISLKKHVLVMTFLGLDSSPSPQLKEANLSKEQVRLSYIQVLDIMKRMYRECQLVHGDLSEYNLIWHKEQVYVIDVSQSMFSSHPSAMRFLYRDCKNIHDFYSRSGLTDILDPKSLFTMITGKDLRDKDIELWCRIQDFPANEKLMQREDNTNEAKSDDPDAFIHMLDSIKVRGKL